jgi:hypothetical protein
MAETKIDPDVEEIVADSIQFGFSNRIKREIISSKAEQNTSLEEMTVKGSEGWCYHNAVRSAYFLWSRYPDSFQNIMVIRSDIDPQANLEFKRAKNWKMHAGLIFEDKSGKWHYISPANYNSNSDRKLNPLFTHVTAESLKSLIAEVENLETTQNNDSNVHLWPNSEEISAVLNEKPQRKAPSLNKRNPEFLSVPVVNKVNKTVTEAEIKDYTENFEIPINVA